jgi:hypothetical protein
VRGYPTHTRAPKSILVLADPSAGFKISGTLALFMPDCMTVTLVGAALTSNQTSPEMSHSPAGNEAEVMSTVVAFGEK